MVADIVGRARKIVKGMHMRAQIGPDEKRANGEIFRIPVFTAGGIGNIALNGVLFYALPS